MKYEEYLDAIHTQYEKLADKEALEKKVKSLREEIALLKKSHNEDLGRFRKIKEDGDNESIETQEKIRVLRESNSYFKKNSEAYRNSNKIVALSFLAGLVVSLVACYFYEGDTSIVITSFIILLVSHFVVRQSFK